MGRTVLVAALVSAFLSMIVTGATMSAVTSDISKKSEAAVDAADAANRWSAEVVRRLDGDVQAQIEAAMMVGKSGAATAVEAGRVVVGLREEIDEMQTQIRLLQLRIGAPR
jgi:hypothetical protein